ncbi:MAG: AgmX/PglI C-terminal domain-containing protein [Candidatus Binatia bacterium]
MDTLSGRWLGTRPVVVFAACGFVVGLVLLGYGTGAKYDNSHDSSPKSTRPESAGEKPQPRSSPALGNVVIMASEVGFSVSGLRESNGQEAKISKRIENQLFGLRKIYQQEVDKSQTLVGSILLELAVSPSGNIAHVKELASRLTDNDFKKVVLAEVYKWKFPEIGPEPVRINLPLLFVREGMDLITLIEWEKAFGSSKEKGSLLRSAGERGQEYKAPRNATQSLALAEPKPSGAGVNQKPDPSGQQPKRLATKTVVGVYELRSPARVRKEPRFASPSLASVPAGTKVTVVAVRGDWLEIRSEEGGLPGFIPKEFATLVDGAQEQ